MNPAPWMGRRGREVETGDGGLGATKAWYGTQEELLERRGAAAVDRPLKETAVMGLELGWPEHTPCGDESAKSGRRALDGGLEGCHDPRHDLGMARGSAWSTRVGPHDLP
jgi:hypothetical protein